MERWGRFKYFPVLPLGEDGRMITGSKEHIQLSRTAAGEGMVLLKNENHTLPLKNGHKVALFGRGCVDYVKGGGGSGDTTVAYTTDFCEAMMEKEKAGRVQVFQPLCDFYRENVAYQRAQTENLQPGQTSEPDIPKELFDAAVAECDTAIISICRFSYENADRTGELQDGDFYLSKQEQNLVNLVLANFEKTIVVLNVGGMVDTTWFYEETRIPAVLLAWQGGMEGAAAQADILFGDVNPSGKLTDTFAKSFDDYPSSYNFHESEDYVCYTEDVFVGYRYFETIPGAAERVNYPFGYGLSYTEFAIECRKAYETDGVLHIDVAVTNTGTVAGKEVVQIYSGAPKCRLEMLERLKQKERYSYDLMSIPTMPQLRTIRRIVGDTDFTAENGKTYSDSIGKTGDFRPEYIGNIYEVPLSAQYNSDFPNLICAGRIISAPEGNGWEVARVIPTCAMTGEAAGNAAAYYLKYGSFCGKSLEEQ